MLSNQEIAQVFLAIADSMEVQGEQKFKYLAYRRAGELIAGLNTSLADIAASGKLQELPGIGQAIAAKIDELLKTGKLEFYERLRREVPAGLIDLMHVPEIGPKTAARLYHEEGITGVDALRQAAEEGRLRKIKGMGAKTEQRILLGLQALASQEQRMLLATALPVAEELAAALLATGTVKAIEPTGSLRRARPTVGDLDLLAASDDPAAAVAAFTKLTQVAQTLSSGDRKATVALHSGLTVDLLVVEPARWGSGLLHFTGSKEHNIQFRERTQQRGLTFSEYGFRSADSEILCATEAQAYAVLGLDWVPPELREAWGEIEAAELRTLPELLPLDALRGDLHMHTTWSDGKGSVAQMAQAAHARGYSYIAISDHSHYMGVTGGLASADDVRRQREEIDAVNADFAQRGVDFAVLHSCEVDILPDGALALADDILTLFDFVIASPHVALRQEREKATERMLRAIRHPLVHFIAHPTGRLIGGRAGQDLDMEAVLDAAAAAGTALEVNAGPDRLDLDAEYVKAALARGIKLVISSDAHHPDGLAGIRLGVLTARRGWATAGDVINTWPLDALRQHFAKKRATS